MHTEAAIRDHIYAHFLHIHTKAYTHIAQWHGLAAAHLLVSSRLRVVHVNGIGDVQVILGLLLQSIASDCLWKK
jgi:hypothetical protein